MLRYAGLAAIALIVVLITTAASAVGPCASRSDIVVFLKAHFGEVVVAQGLSSRGHLVEVFVSPAGSWTILLSQPDGQSCLADAGEAMVMEPSAGHSVVQPQPVR